MAPSIAFLQITPPNMDSVYEHLHCTCVVTVNWSNLEDARMNLKHNGNLSADFPSNFRHIFLNV